jgi:hypothetical protein
MDILTALTTPIVLLVVLALAARCGTDSRDGIETPPQVWVGGSR